MVLSINDLHCRMTKSRGELLCSVLCLTLAFFPMRADAFRESTAEALDRLEEILFVVQEDNANLLDDALPMLIVDIRPKYELSQGWLDGRVTQLLTRVFPGGEFRDCVACRFPRTYAEPGRLEQRTGPVGVIELRSLDRSLRGNSAAARSGIWLEETARGVSVKIVQLASGRILLAENIDPQRGERAISAQRVERLRELERRNRGEGITHAFVDIGLYPGQHISGDWVEQWGPNNRQLSGLSVSLFDPVLGIGAAHYWVLPFGESVVGAKLLMSFPTATAEFAASLADEDEDPPELIDPLLNLVAVYRMPIARSNYGVTVTASTNGRVTVGLSLLNTSFLPVLP